MKFQDLATEAVYRDPYPTYSELHRDGPLLSLAPGMWITGDYHVVDTLLRDRRLGHAYMQFIVGRYGEEKAQGARFQAAAKMMITSNAPQHTRLRGVLHAAFAGQQTERFEQLAKNKAQSLIARIADDKQADLMTQFALPFALQVICDMLGTSYEDTAFLNEKIGIMARGLDAAPMNDAQLQEGNEATEALQAYFAQVLADRRKQPGDDLVSRLLALEKSEGGASDDELVANIVMLFMAGHETTANMLGNALIALYRNPDQLALLRQDLSLVPDAVAECLRYDTSVQMVRRVAFEDIEVEGTVVPKGHMVFMCLGAAGRDPKVFEQPDTLKIGRAEKKLRLLAFAGGIHHCLGARLAVTEIETGLHALLSALPNLRLTGLDNLQWHPRNTLRGVTSLMAAWD